MNREYGTKATDWGIAAVATLLLHLGTVLGVRALDPVRPADRPPPEPDVVELIFAEPPRQEPRFFSELPEDRADRAPERADALSNVDSRARDEVPGGEDALPRLDGASEAPQIRMDRGEPEAASPESPPSPFTPEDPVPEDREPEEESAEAASVEPSRPRPSIPEEQTDPRLRPPGTSDIFQDSMSNPESNAELSGIVSINTTAWEYAPWLKAFRRAVGDRWKPPIAYHMGLISGWVLVEVAISPSGELTVLRTLDRDVDHPSLEEVVEYALRAAAPYRPLPDHFPEDQLVLQIKFVYPGARR